MGQAIPVSGSTGTSIHLEICFSEVIFIKQAGMAGLAKLGQANIKLPSGAIAIPSGVGQLYGSSINNLLTCRSLFA